MFPLLLMKIWSDQTRWPWQCECDCRPTEHPLVLTIANNEILAAKLGTVEPSTWALISVVRENGQTLSAGLVTPWVGSTDDLWIEACAHCEGVTYAPRPQQPHQPRLLMLPLTLMLTCQTFWAPVRLLPHPQGDSLGIRIMHLRTWNVEAW